MSVSVTKYKNLVGGEWVDAASGETMEVLNPSTGEVIAEVPSSSAEDVERAVEAARKALPTWLDKTPKDRMELLLKLADVIDDNADELTQLESQNVGKPMVDRGRRDAVLGRQPPLLRRRRPHARGQGRRRVRRGLHVDHPARAARDRRRDHTLELPADDGDLEARARARRRQRPDPEAGRADAADDAPLRRAGAGVPAARRAPGRHRATVPRRATRSSATRRSGSSR